MDITVTKSHRDFIIQDYNIIFPPLLQRLSQKLLTGTCGDLQILSNTQQYSSWSDSFKTEMLNYIETTTLEQLRSKS